MWTRRDPLRRDGSPPCTMTSHSSNHKPRLCVELASDYIIHQCVAAASGHVWQRLTVEELDEKNCARSVAESLDVASLQTQYLTSRSENQRISSCRKARVLGC